MNAVDAVTAYEIFRDLITFFLAVAAVASGVAGAVIYKIFRILSDDIEKKVTLATKRAIYSAFLNNRIAYGYDYWSEYKHGEYLFSMEGVSEEDLNKGIFPKEFKNMLENEAIPLTVPITKEKKTIFVVRKEDGNPHIYKKDIWKLDQAIKATRRGYDLYVSELDEQERESERLICLAKNNLAYYYAERQKFVTVTSGEKKLAQDFAKYIYDRIDRYPEEAENWIDTYKFVQQQFPFKGKDSNFQ